MKFRLLKTDKESKARAGELPDNPYLVIGQQSLADPSRAPEGKHTAAMLFDVPPEPVEVNGRKLSGSIDCWDDIKEEVGDIMINRWEEYAPGFKKLIRHVHIESPLPYIDPDALGDDTDEIQGLLQIVEYLVHRRS